MCLWQAFLGTLTRPFSELEREAWGISGAPPALFGRHRALVMQINACGEKNLSGSVSQHLKAGEPASAKAP